MRVVLLLPLLPRLALRNNKKIHSHIPNRPGLRNRATTPSRVHTFLAPIDTSRHCMLPQDGKTHQKVPQLVVVERQLPKRLETGRGALPPPPPPSERRVRQTTADEFPATLRSQCPSLKRRWRRKNAASPSS